MLTFIFYIFSYDIWFYISHVILHYSYFYKNIHKKHHNIDCKTMQYKDTYTSNWIESPLQGLGLFIPLLCVPFNPYIFLCALLFVNIRGMIRHDRRFVWLIGNHHILHHKYPQYNFGEYWLDTLCGTKYPNKNEYVIGIIYN
jgi:Delta7-sterol 5-desaturase